MLNKITARLRQLSLRERLAFNWWRYDRLIDQRRRIRDKQDAISDRIDQIESAQFRLYAKNAWLTPTR